MSPDLQVDCVWLDHYCSFGSAPACTTLVSVQNEGLTSCLHQLLQDATYDQAANLREQYKQSLDYRWQHDSDHAYSPCRLALLSECEAGDS